MGMLYTSLPYSDPVRQQYQTIIDNSRRSLAKKRASEWKSETASLAAQVKDGKIVDTWSDRNKSRSANYSSFTDRRSEQQLALQDLYEMMRGGYFGRNMFGLF